MVLEQGDYELPKGIEISHDGLDFLTSCLQYDPEKRLSLDQLMEHKYVCYDQNKFMVDQKDLHHQSSQEAIKLNIKSKKSNN